MSSLIRPLEDIASCEIPYWLAPGGRDNGVWADIWVLIADLETDDASVLWYRNGRLALDPKDEVVVGLLGVAQKAYIPLTLAGVKAADGEAVNRQFSRGLCVIK